MPTARVQADELVALPWAQGPEATASGVWLASDNHDNPGLERLAIGTEAITAGT